MGSILYDVYSLGQNALGQNALGQNTLGQIYKLVLFLSSTVFAPGRTLDVGQGQCQEKFLWSDSPSVGGESDGKRHCRKADCGRMEVFTATKIH